MRATISIHTPVKGVTLPGGVGIPPAVISIHTPVKGVTTVVTDADRRIVFQSTHP